MPKAIFLDRDGVLNHAQVRNGKSYAPCNLEDFRLLPGVARAVHDLRAGGFLIVVVTNQPDIAAGKVTREIVEAMHARLRAWVPVDAIEVCPHSAGEGCACRKPNPGMLRAAAQRLGIDPEQSFMVGDRHGDILAGQRSGCRTVLIDRGYSEPQIAEPDLVVASLPQAARRILDLVDAGQFGRYSA